MRLQFARQLAIFVVGSSTTDDSRYCGAFCHVVPHRKGLQPLFRAQEATILLVTVVTTPTATPDATGN
jgi:hypothetical protein